MLVTTAKNLAILTEFVHQPGVSMEDRIKRVHALLGDMNSAINTFFSSAAKMDEKGASITVNTGDVVNFNNIDLSNVDPDTLRGLLPWFRSAFCEGCPLRRKDVIDVKEVD